ncbi:MAG: YlxM family DNA-binding protein [Bacillota bacterium]
MDKRVSTGGASRLERANRVILLGDYYGQLLTERQRDILSLHYEDDLSLGEIAESLSVSRQAVHDLLSRSEEALEDYEARLGLVARDGEARRLVAALARSVAALDPDNPQKPRMERFIKRLKARF